jgi:DNA topoisomerase VI subunit B
VPIVSVKHTDTQFWGIVVGNIGSYRVSISSSAELVGYYNLTTDQNIKVTAIAIVAVHIQPNNLSLGVMTNRPIISSRAAINTITAIMGTEITSLMTAL